MNSALWTLLGLQFYSYLRYFTRSLRTVKGALLAGVGVLFLIPYLAGLALLPTGSGPVDPDVLRQNGPAFLLIYCILQIVLSGNQSSLYFSPAEVQFLFSGPFSRRQILLYKITLLTLLTLPLPLIFSLLLRQHAGSWLSAMLAMLCGVMFLTLFSLAVNLLRDYLGTSLYNRTRVITLSVVLLAVIVGLAVSGGESAELARSTLVRVVCWPVTWFFELFLASTLFPDLLVALAMSLLVNFGLLMVVFSLDRNLLELSATNSERMYALIQQARRGQTALAAGTGGAGWSLPDFPYLAGVGPILWRQMMLALRGLGRLVFLLVLVGGFATFGMVSSSPQSDPSADSLFGTTVSLLIMMTFFMTVLVPFDFRGDVDNLAMLKTLPVPPWALVVGQLLTPTLLTTLFHWGVLACMTMLALARGTPLPLEGVIAMACMFPALNFLIFGVENLLFLIFPMRILQATPGDFQSFGRNILMALGKFFVLLVVIGLASAFGVAVYAVSGFNLPLGFGAAWLVLFTAGIALVPGIMLAFARYDVGRDTPP